MVTPFIHFKEKKQGGINLNRLNPFIQPKINMFYVCFVRIFESL